MVIEILAAGGFAAAGVTVALFVITGREPRTVKDPRKIGLPTGGLATRAAAHAVLTGQPAKRRRWKFW